MSALKEAWKGRAPGGTGYRNWTGVLEAEVMPGF
jgi:hypothetical protein